MWLDLVLIMATSLSSFLWLPCTGITVSHAQLIMISISTFVLSVAAYFIAWKRSERSNKSLEPTAAAAMRRFSFMRQFSEFAVLASASGGSALSR